MVSVDDDDDGVVPCPRVPVSPAAVDLCMSQVAQLKESGWGDLPELALIQALHRWAHFHCCENPSCRSDDATPRAQLKVWCGLLLDHFKTPSGAARAMVSGHPVVVMPSLFDVGSAADHLCFLFYAVVLVHDMGGEPSGPLFEVLGDRAPVVLAGFSPDWGPGVDFIPVGPWTMGAKGHG